MKNDKLNTKENFLTTLSSMTPEEVTDLILKESKIKTLTNIVERIK